MWILLAPALVLVLSWSAFGSPSDAGVETTPRSNSADIPAPSLGDYLRDSVPDVLGGTERIFSRDTVPMALTGIGLTGLALFVDHRVDDYFRDRNPMSHVEKYGRKIGSGYPELGIGLALFSAGELAGDRKLADTGITSLEACGVDVVITEALKYAVGRKRPNNEDRLSFPSGHASITAAMAASISEMYDWDLKISVPLYVTTAFVGASRLQAHEHYLSDVVAGTTLGTVVGIGFARYRKETNAAGEGRTVAVTPLLDSDVKGWMVTLNF
jgi:hypothetical protein